MAVLRTPGEGGTFIDVLDRVLDKGIVIDGWGTVAVVGLDLIGLKMTMVVASIETYLRYADALGVGTQNVGTQNAEGRITLSPQ